VYYSQEIGIMIGDEARLMVEAYAQIRRDFPSLMDTWLNADEVVTLLKACYDFQRAGMTLDATRLNNAVGHHGDFVLGANFDDSLPRINEQGHYRVTCFINFLDNDGAAGTKEASTTAAKSNKTGRKSNTKRTVFYYLAATKTKLRRHHLHSANGTQCFENQNKYALKR